MKAKNLKIIYSGLIAGLVAQGILGLLFMSPPIQAILYNPQWQSELFMEVTPQLDILLSVAGLVLLSVIHSWLFSIFQTSIPGKKWIKKGLFWGFNIWLMFWLFQEWFIYHTLLREPLLLNLLELVILLVGSLVEGLVISKFLYEGNP